MIRELRAVLFDAVGTLIFPNPPVADVYYRFGSQFGSSLARDQISDRFSTVYGKWENTSVQFATSEIAEREKWKSIVSEIFDDVVDASGPLFNSLWNHFAKPESWSVYDDVEDAWDRFVELDLVVGIASNFDDRLKEICAELKPLQDCENVFWSSRIGFAKPAKQFFETIESRLRIDSREILMVGDNYRNDYLGAINAGWKAVLLDRSLERSSDITVHTLTELPSASMRRTE